MYPSSSTLKLLLVSLLFLPCAAFSQQGPSALQLPVPQLTALTSTSDAQQPPQAQQAPPTSDIQPDIRS